MVQDTVRLGALFDRESRNDDCLNYVLRDSILLKSGNTDISEPSKSLCLQNNGDES